MARWRQAKAPFLEKLPSLIYEYPETVTFELDKKVVDSRFSDFITWLEDKGFDSLASFFIINKEGLYDNKTCESFYIARNETWVPVGMKIGKALKLFDFYQSEDLEVIRQELSRIIQENTVKGKLCLSIHPLDYLSLSENNHNWRSCHALDGEYRTGNLSYMLDNCTVIAYLKSEKEDEILPRFPEEVPWNSKKWRCLLFFDRDRKIVWAGRQYPFSTDAALNFVVSNLLEPLNFFEPDKTVLPKLFWEGWQCPILSDEIQFNNYSTSLTEQYVVSDGKINPINKWIVNDPDSLAFNDLTQSSFYRAMWFKYGGGARIPNRIHAMKVGAEVPCVHCGQDIVHYSETMMCNRCVLESDIEMDEITECVECGRRIFTDLEYSYGGDYYCPECYHEYIKTCYDCGETFYTRHPDSHMDIHGHYKCDSCIANPDEDLNNY